MIGSDSHKQIWSLADMFGLFGYDIYFINQSFHVLKNAMVNSAHSNDMGPDYIIAPMPVEIKIWGDLETLIQVCQKMNLESIIDQVERIKRVLGRNHKIGELETEITALQNRMEDELQRHWFYYIDREKVKIFDNPVPAFGQEVFDKFGTASDDISEAVKCYALGRHTATVFHCMRALESGVRAVARSLEIPDPTRGAEKNWGAILSEIGNGIKAKWPDAKSQLAPDHSLFQVFNSSLNALKYSRNDTMHLSKNYDEYKAKHFLDIIGGFMRQLAKRMDENGLPLA